MTPRAMSLNRLAEKERKKSYTVPREASSGLLASEVSTLELCINPLRSALSKRAWLLPLLSGIFFGSFLSFKTKVHDKN